MQMKMNEYGGWRLEISVRLWQTCVNTDGKKYKEEEF